MGQRLEKISVYRPSDSRKRRSTSARSRSEGRASAVKRTQVPQEELTRRGTGISV